MTGHMTGNEISVQNDVYARHKTILNIILLFINGCRIYVDIMTGDIYSLPIWKLFIGQFVHSV